MTKSDQIWYSSNQSIKLLFTILSMMETMIWEFFLRNQILSLSLSLAGVEFRAALPDISIEKRLRLIVCELPSVSFFIFSLFTEDNIATLMVAVCWWSFESDDCAATPPTSFTFMPPTRINESDEPILSTWPSLLLLWISMSLNWFLLNWITLIESAIL